jgi:hypothetical protein
MPIPSMSFAADYRFVFPEAETKIRKLSGNNQLWWNLQDNTRPGERNEPTLINNTPWKPDWPQGTMDFSSKFDLNSIGVKIPSRYKV